MAIASMQKVMIVAHRSRTVELLGALQASGIVQILDAERAMVTKQWPELVVESRRHRSLEEMIDRLEAALDFIKPYAPKDETSLFAPLVPVDASTYDTVVAGQDAISCLGEIEHVRGDMEKLAAETETQHAQLAKLTPWAALDIAVEELGTLSGSTTFAGLIGEQHFAAACEKLDELDAIIEKVDMANRTAACIVVCFNENAPAVQKALRSVEFEAVAFEGITGTASENIAGVQQRLEAIQKEQDLLIQQMTDLAQNKLQLQILFDHYQNLINRIQAESTAPATDHAVFLEGWVRKRDYDKLEKLVRQFDATDLTPIEPAEGEETPVEIDNGPLAEPFESVTRLYGMPAVSDVDPTAFLAPFFALFFGICLTDAAYGLVMIAFFWWMLRKIKGDKKFIMMMIFCSISTVIAGALTGGWCGDAVQQFVPALSDLRAKLMWFDPMDDPMKFFYLSLGLGYLQIIAGIFIGFWHKLRRGDVQGALFDHLSWFIWLNSLAVFGLAKAGVFGEKLIWLGTIAGLVAIVPALAIVLFSEREGGWGARVGMGLYNVFSTVFYVGDVLSYIRLMALGMVTAGFGMAINQIVLTVMEAGVIGWILGALIFIGGHLFNIANSALGSFVHSMRLQFVEFFTKFLAGGGKQFDPLRQNYRYIDVKKDKS
ncbi:MAG: V-type ATP synthase subunit I [Planctomycetota bacterium]|jgi:V/A-type H+-transporting ATPase subunit I